MTFFRQQNHSFIRCKNNALLAALNISMITPELNKHLERIIFVLVFC